MGRVFIILTPLFLLWTLSCAAMNHASNPLNPSGHDERAKFLEGAWNELEDEEGHSSSQSSQEEDMNAAMSEEVLSSAGVGVEQSSPGRTGVAVSEERMDEADSTLSSHPPPPDSAEQSNLSRRKRNPPTEGRNKQEKQLEIEKAPLTSVYHDEGIKQCKAGLGVWFVRPESDAKNEPGALLPVAVLTIVNFNKNVYLQDQLYSLKYSKAVQPELVFNITYRMRCVSDYASDLEFDEDHTVEVEVKPATIGPSEFDGLYGSSLLNYYLLDSNCDLSSVDVLVLKDSGDTTASRSKKFICMWPSVSKFLVTHETYGELMERSKKQKLSPNHRDRKQCKGKPEVLYAVPSYTDDQLQLQSEKRSSIEGRPEALKEIIKKPSKVSGIPPTTVVTSVDLNKDDYLRDILYSLTTSNQGLIKQSEGEKGQLLVFNLNYKIRCSDFNGLDYFWKELEDTEEAKVIPINVPLSWGKGLGLVGRPRAKVRFLGLEGSSVVSHYALNSSCQFSSVDIEVFKAKIADARLSTERGTEEIICMLPPVSEVQGFGRKKKTTKQELLPPSLPRRQRKRFGGRRNLLESRRIVKAGLTSTDHDKGRKQCKGGLDVFLVKGVDVKDVPSCSEKIVVDSWAAPAVFVTRVDFNNNQDLNDQLYGLKPNVGERLVFTFTYTMKCASDDDISDDVEKTDAVDLKVKVKPVPLQHHRRNHNPTFTVSGSDGLSGSYLLNHYLIDSSCEFSSVYVVVSKESGYTAKLSRSNNFNCMLPSVSEFKVTGKTYGELMEQSEEQKLSRQKPRQMSTLGGCRRKPRKQELSPQKPQQMWKGRKVDLSAPQ